MVSIKARLHVLLERVPSYGIAPLSVCVSLITDDLSLRLFIDWPGSCETTGVSIRRVIEKWNGIETHLRAARHDYLVLGLWQKLRRRGQSSNSLGETLQECITIPFKEFGWGFSSVMSLK